MHVAQTRSAVAEQAWLAYWPDGQAPEHAAQEPADPAPQPVTYWPAAQVRGLGQLAQTRLAVAVQAVTWSGSRLWGGTAGGARD